MDKTVVVSVAVDQTVYLIDKPYDYVVPAAFQGLAKPGCRVLVPFGNGNVRKTGMILRFSEVDDLSKLKYIISVLDEEPILSQKMLDLASFLHEYTFCTWYNAIRVLLPPGINFKIQNEYCLSDNYESFLEDITFAQQQVISYLTSSNSSVSKDNILQALGHTDDSKIIDELVSKGILIRADHAVRKIGDASLKMVRLTDAVDSINSLKLTSKQKYALSVLTDMGCCSVREFCYFTGFTVAVITGLQKKGLVEVFEQEYYRNPYNNVTVTKNDDINLTDSQIDAFNKLLSDYKANEGKTALLYGVTGSGKTQVFLKLCERVANEGKGVIVMVPEISLTPQTLGIFHRRFGEKVAVFHSAMSQGQRLDEWKRVKRGEAIIAVGTRSAVFAPFEEVGLIIMDEEQEHTYKSEMSPHFHARDVARYRVAKDKSLLVLSSATPSIESYSLALAGKYTLCKLDKRFGSAVLPEVETVDMRQEVKNGNSGIISNLLYDRISTALKSNHQAILLLNRRGFNTFISCPTCGNSVNCDNCSISMTYHSANNRLMCHYCGKSVPYIDKCPKCNSDRIKYSGIGTQKAELELSVLFPEARILRMDTDSTMTKSDYEKNLTAFANGKYDIMLGTQMVAKGLDFPKVTVVGVLNSDFSMHSNDFRSFERTFSLLTQVVGRSGRGVEKGTAVIQTNEPDSPIIDLAAKQDYNAFYESEILTRRLMIYPPFCDIATANFSGVERKLTEDAARFFFDILKQTVSAAYNDIKLIILGPTSAAIPKVNNSYKYKLIIKYKNSNNFRKMMNGVIADYNKSSYAKKVTAFIDVNPDSII